MRIFMMVAAVAALMATPAAAQDAQAEAHSLALAQRYLTLSMGTGITEFMEEQFSDIFGKTEASTEERDWMTRQMTQTMANVLTLTLADLNDDVVELFTDEELTALIAFYDTEMGQSIADKNLALSVAMQEAMMPHLTTAITSFGEKYCARFGCDETGAGLAGKAF